MSIKKHLLKSEIFPKTICFTWSNFFLIRGIKLTSRYCLFHIAVNHNAVSNYEFHEFH